MPKSKSTPKEQRADDARFDKVYSDPRFMAAPSKLKKVEIDSRFKTMFSDKQFNQVAAVDKYGRKVNKQDTHALENYYSKPQSKAEQALEETGKRFYDDDGNFDWEGGSSSEQEEGEAELEEGSLSDDISGVWSNASDPAPAATSVAPASDKVGRRLAVTNLDWDNVSSPDLYVLFTSFCHSQAKGGQIEKVQIYPSLFGLEQMKRDSMYGPPKEMFATQPVNKKKAKYRNSKGEVDRELFSDDEF